MMRPIANAGDYAELWRQEAQREAGVPGGGDTDGESEGAAAGNGGEAGGGEVEEEEEEVGKKGKGKKRKKQASPMVQLMTGKRCGPPRRRKGVPGVLLRLRPWVGRPRRGGSRAARPSKQGAQGAGEAQGRV